MSNKVTNLLAQASQKLEKYDLGSALRLYHEALELDPENGAAAMGLAMVLNRNNQSADALPILRRIWAAISVMVKKPPQEQMAAVLAQMGLAQQQLGQVMEALDSYRQAARLVNSEDLERRIKQLAPLANSPKPVQQLILHARQLHASRQHEEAIRTYRAALQLQADSAEALHGLAMVLRELRSIDEALTLLQKATVLAPDRAEYFNDLGMLFQDKGDFTKAISFHGRALKLLPNFSWAHINMGVAYKRLGQHKEALAAYLKALQINPNSPEGHSNVGNLYRIIGDFKNARMHMQRAIELRPGYQDAIVNLLALQKQIADAESAKPGKAKPSQKSKPGIKAAKPAGNGKAMKPAPSSAKPKPGLAPAKKPVVSNKVVAKASVKAKPAHKPVPKSAKPVKQTRKKQAGKKQARKANRKKKK